MIELNLLPKELRKRKQKKRVELDLANAKIPYVLIAVCVISFLIGVHVILFFFALDKKALSRTMAKQWDYALTQRQRAEAVNKQAGDLQIKLSVIRKIVKPSVDGAKLLSGLNQAVIQGVWLSSLDVNLTQPGNVPPDSHGKLILEGYALGGSEQATSLVARFILSLKANPDFSAYFPEVELDTLESREFVGEEVMQFRLNCRFVEKENIPADAAESDKEKKKLRR